MEPYLYSEMNIVCCLILGILQYRMIINTDKQHRNYFFSHVIIIGMVFILVDLVWGLILNDTITVSKEFLYVYNVVYYGLSSVICCFWALYSTSYINPEAIKKKINIYLQFIPFVLLMILMITSCFTHISFWVDDNLTYVKGKLYILQMILAYIPALYTFAYEIYSAAKEEHYALKKEYLSLASFAIFPVLLGVLQIFFLSMPLLSVGIMMGILLVYLNITESRISMDSLTKINNRNQFNYNLQKEMNDLSKNSSLYLIMMDADYFKEINDGFGHSEGDRALIEIANVLKKICADHRNSSVYRYGGDEFVMIVKESDGEDVNQICLEIQNKMKNHNEELQLPYNLKVSIGYTKYDSSMKSIPDFVKAADKELYAVKRARVKE